MGNPGRASIDFGIPKEFLGLFLFFGITAFIGWLLESGYRSIASKRWVNAGFLRGPFVPIYGFAAVAILEADRYGAALLPIQARWAVLLLLPSVLEYFAGLLLEKTVKARLWDYSGEFLNVKGRVCLKFSIVWAILVVADLKLLQPALLSAIALFSERSLYLAGGALLSALALDAWQSILVYADFKRMLQKLMDAIAKGTALPAIPGLLGGKLSLEWKRFLRPLRAFPDLKRRVDTMGKALPQEILERMHKLRGSAWGRIDSFMRKGKR